MKYLRVFFKKSPIRDLKEVVNWSPARDNVSDIFNDDDDVPMPQLEEMNNMTISPELRELRKQEMRRILSQRNNRAPDRVYKLPRQVFRKINRNRTHGIKYFDKKKDRIMSQKRVLMNANKHRPENMQIDENVIMPALEWEGHAESLEPREIRGNYRLEREEEFNNRRGPRKKDAMQIEDEELILPALEWEGDLNRVKVNDPNSRESRVRDREERRSEIDNRRGPRKEQKKSETAKNESFNSPNSRQTRSKSASALPRSSQKLTVTIANPQSKISNVKKGKKKRGHSPEYTVQFTKRQIPEKRKKDDDKQKKQDDDDDDDSEYKSWTGL